MSDKVTVYIDRDEWYPIYGMFKDKRTYTEVITEVPVEFYERYQKALDEFTAVNDEIEDIFFNHENKS